MMQYIDEIDFGSLECFTDGQKVAIYDFAYNAGRHKRHNITGVPFSTYVKRCDKNSIEQFIYPGNYPQKGLKIRRQAEWNAWHS